MMKANAFKIWSRNINGKLYKLFYYHLMMMFKVHDDWKRNLSAEDEARLNAVLRKVAKHRPAYRSAHDVRIAQLWASVLELDKEKSSGYMDLEKRVRRIEVIFEAIADKLNEEEIKRHVLKESLEKF